MIPSRIALASSAIAGLALFSACAASDPPSDASNETVERLLDGEQLSILLTNDDGWGAPGIVATRDALVEAGHEVTVVAPSDNFSGVSSAIDYSGELTVEQVEDGVYTVSGTPATSVVYGITEVLGGTAPDLVVSGSNVGANTGFDQNFSGTIGAAVVASGLYDVPAIAVSTATRHGEEAEAAYEETAAFLVDLLATGEVDVRSGEVLNINYPLLDGSTDPEVEITPSAVESAAAFAFEESEPGVWAITPARSEDSPAAGSDAAALAEGSITIGLLKVDRTAGADRLDGLEAAVSSAR